MKLNPPVNRLVEDLPKICIYTNIGGRLQGVCLRITIYIHNMGKEKIFRSEARTSFRTFDLVGADFRACVNFGSLCGKNLF